jgi:GNAT superfamily N-acetyltransferase
MDDRRTAKPATIRLYQPEDLPSCRNLWVELTEWHRAIYQSPGIGGSDPGSLFDEHLNRVGPAHIWVAEIDGQVVGLAGLIPGEGEAELEPIVVSELYRGRGIGRQLAETIIEAAQTRGARQLKVRPVARNAPAIGFFHELGFDVLGHVELFMDFGPVERQIWRPGEQMADRVFRV